MKFNSNKTTIIIPIFAKDVHKHPSAIKWSDVTEEQAKVWVNFKDQGPRYSESSRYIFWTTYGEKKGFFFRCGKAKTAVIQMFFESKIPFSQKNDFVIIEK